MWRFSPEVILVNFKQNIPRRALCFGCLILDLGIAACLAVTLIANIWPISEVALYSHSLTHSQTAWQYFPSTYISSVDIYKFRWRIREVHRQGSIYTNNATTRTTLQMQASMYCVETLHNFCHDLWMPKCPRGLLHCGVISKDRCISLREQWSLQSFKRNKRRHLKTKTQPAKCHKSALSAISLSSRKAIYSAKSSVSSAYKQP